jgi:hypothetical protein
VAENKHSQYVNKRLSSVRPLLANCSQTEGGQRSTVGFYHTACVDAAALQLYFAVFHYVNELLVMYQQPIIENTPWQLRDTIIQQSQNVAELNEWKQLLQQPDSFLSLLVKYPKTMLQADSAAECESDEQNILAAQARDNAVIPLVNLGSDENKTLYLTEHNIHWVMDECYRLIQRQREHLIEC